MRKFLLAAIATMFLTIGFGPKLTVQASSGASFTMTPVLTNKASQKVNYFDVTGKSNDDFSLAVDVFNRTDKVKHITVEPTNAYTSDTGTVVYDPQAPKDSSAQYRFTQLATAGQTLTIEPHQTMRSTVVVTIPKKGLRGQVIGGIYAIDRASYGKRSSGINIRNKYAMYVPVVVKTSAKFVTPNLRLSHVRLGMQNGGAAVLAQLQNSQPQIFGHLRISSRVYKGKGKKALLKRTVTGYAMAPNSHFDYATPTKTALAAGKYTMVLTAKSGDKVWHFKRNFTVKRQAASKIDQQSGLSTVNIPWWMYLIVIVLIIAVVVLIWLLVKRSHQIQNGARK